MSLIQQQVLNSYCLVIHGHEIQMHVPQIPHGRPSDTHDSVLPSERTEHLVQFHCSARDTIREVHRRSCQESGFTRRSGVPLWGHV